MCIDKLKNWFASVKSSQTSSSEKSNSNSNIVNGDITQTEEEDSNGSTIPATANSSTSSSATTINETNSNVYIYWVNCTKTKLLDKDPNSYVKQGITDLYVGTNREDHTIWGKAGTIEDVIKKFKDSGIRIHAWIPTFKDANGGWISPKNWSTTKINDFGTILDIVKDLNKIEGLAGIHFDSIRYPGTAKGDSASINSFCKSAREACPNKILTGAIMGEPSANTYSYGQDASAMLSAGLDYLVAMIYRCTYGGDQTWMKEVMTAFHAINPTRIIAGVCCYNSDDDATSYSASTLLSDIKAMINAGSKGFAIFIEHLSNFTGLTLSTASTTTTTTTTTTTNTDTSLIKFTFTSDRQDTNWNCGPSALKMALSVFGLNVSETYLATVAGTNSTDGTTVKNMVNAITSVNNAFGVSLKADYETFSTWQKLRNYMAKGAVIVLRVQSWVHPDTGEHYVFMFGLDIANNKAYLADPNHDNREIKLDDLLVRIKKVSSASIIVIQK